MPKLLILSRYDDLGASSRLRMLQYVPALEAAGWTVRVEPLLSNPYLLAIYDPHKDIWRKIRRLGLVARGYFRRLRFLLQRSDYDIAWIEKELFPFLPSSFEKLLARDGRPYVIDYDDAVFHNYDRSGNPFVRKLLGQKLHRLIARSSAVTAGNEYLSDYARRQGAEHIEYIPTVIDLDRYQVAPEPPDNVFRIGWIGSPSSAQYLPLIYGALQRLAQKREIVFVTIGAPPISVPGVKIEQHDWSLETEASLIRELHVGIMPLNDTPWERGKCGYKLIQYMACGRPVVASPIGINKEIVSSAVGRLADDEEEWIQALDELASAPELRQRLGKMARLAVESSFTKQVVAPKIDRVLRKYVKVKR